MPPNPPAHTQLRRRQLQAPTPPAPATETLSSTYYRSLLDAIIALSVISILCVLALGFQALYYRRKWLRNIAVNGASRRKTIDITFDGESDISVAGTIDSASVRSVPNPKSYKLPAPQPPIPLQVFAPPSVPHPHLSAPHLRPPAGREPQRGVRPPRRPPQSIRHPPRGPQRQPPRSRIATGQPRTPRSRPTHSDAASEPSAEDSQLENIDEIPPPETRRSFPDELPDPARSQFDEPPPQGQPTPSRHSGPPSTAPGNQASSAHASAPPSRAPTLPSIDTHPREWPPSPSSRSPHDTHSHGPTPNQNHTHTPSHPTLASSLHPDAVQQGQGWRASGPEQHGWRRDPSNGAAYGNGGGQVAERGERGESDGADSREPEHGNGNGNEYENETEQAHRHPVEDSPATSRSGGRRPGGGFLPNGTGGGSGSGAGSRGGERWRGARSRGSHL